MSSGALPIQGCGAKIEDRMLLNLVEFIYVSQAKGNFERLCAKLGHKERNISKQKD